MAKNASKARKEFNDKFGSILKKIIVFIYIFFTIATLATYLMPEYEKNCLAEYANGVEDKMLFLNPNENSLSSLFAGIVFFY